MSSAQSSVNAPGARLRLALLRRLAAAPLDALRAERERWPLWLPVLIGIGIAVYFALPAEPPMAAAIALVASAAAFAALVRQRAAAPVALALLACTIGFGAAVWRTDRVAAPVLSHQIGPLRIEGRVVAVLDLAPGGANLVLDRVHLQRRYPMRVPARIKVRMRGRHPSPAIGARVGLLGVLMPPPPPAAPGSYDFARAAWFQRIGAVGYAMGAVTTVSAAPPSLSDGAAVWLTDVRHRLSQHIRAALKPPAGPVAADLLTGDDSGVEAATSLALRNAGLGHLLSISGLHMAMVAGILFFLVRGGLALIPRIALRRPIKKWAAVAALIGTFGYLLLSGSSYPAQRSFLMTAIGLGALMIDRSPISMRVLAVAATILLLAMPEALLNVSFQLSFAAVAALIALYEDLGARLTADRMAGIPGRALAWLGASLASGVACELALAPIAAYQFDRVTSFGAVANLVAIPLFGFWIMPAGVLALALLPFGLADWALALMGWGIDALLALARWVASWPHAVVPLHALPASAFVLMMLGELWIVLWRRPWRWLGLGALGAGAVLAALARPPDMLIARDGRLIAVRDATGGLVFSSPRRAAFARDLWLRRDGRPPDPAVTGAVAAVSCRSAPCRFEASNGVAVAYLPGTPGPDAGCPDAAILVAADAVGRCRGSRLTIDRTSLARDGAHALWLDDDDIRVATAQDGRGDRPWSRRMPDDRPRAFHVWRRRPPAITNSAGTTPSSGPAP